MAVPELGTLAYQFDQLSEQVKYIEQAQQTYQRVVEAQAVPIAVHDEQISGAGGLVKAMENLGSKVDGLNKALWAFAVAFIAAAITITAAIALAVH
jgi:hypothetical protein